MSPKEQAAFDRLVDVLAFYQARVKPELITNCKRLDIIKSSRGAKQ